MDIEELTKVVQDLAARVAAIEEKLTPAKEEALEKQPQGEDKTLSKKLEDALKMLAIANDRIAKLENEPRPRAHAGGGNAAKYTKTLISEEI